MSLQSDHIICRCLLVYNVSSWVVRSFELVISWLSWAVLNWHWLLWPALIKLLCFSKGFNQIRKIAIVSIVKLWNIRLSLASSTLVSSCLIASSCTSLSLLSCWSHAKLWIFRYSYFVLPNISRPDSFLLFLLLFLLLLPNYIHSLNKSFHRFCCHNWTINWLLLRINAVSSWINATLSFVYFREVCVRLDLRMESTFLYVFINNIVLNHLNFLLFVLCPNFCSLNQTYFIQWISSNSVWWIILCVLRVNLRLKSAFGFFLFFYVLLSLPCYFQFFLFLLT